MSEFTIHRCNECGKEVKGKLYNSPRGWWEAWELGKKNGENDEEGCNHYCPKCAKKVGLK